MKPLLTALEAEGAHHEVLSKSSIAETEAEEDPAYSRRHANLSLAAEVILETQVGAVLDCIRALVVTSPASLLAKRRAEQRSIASGQDAPYRADDCQSQ